MLTEALGLPGNTPEAGTLRHGKRKPLTTSPKSWQKFRHKWALPRDTPQAGWRRAEKPARHPGAVVPTKRNARQAERKQERAAWMITAYDIGLVLGALTSAFLISRLAFWFLRHRMAGRRKAVFANSASAVIVITVSIIVRGGLEGGAVVLHLAAQAVWLAADWWMEGPAA